ncbi:flagellar filament capping protein FliD [Sulfurimonas sp.]|nr:flagellar filament capping protein FliD [Sulfurimonas sp.]
MAISSLGVGNNILTQDVLDQLRKADEAGRIRPVELKLADANDKQDALKLIDASMTNFIDSINELKSVLLWNERSATVNSGTSVEITADSNTDVQDFTLNVTQLAEKQIEQSGKFASEGAFVGSGGQMNLNIDGTDYAIDYTATTTLKELKNLINDVAGEKVDATLLNVGATDVRLVISSVDTGVGQDITITNVTGTLDANLTTNTSFVADNELDPLAHVYANLKSAESAEFTFNGQAITRTSNEIDDLITGLTITLKEVGSSEVSVAQDRTSILEKFDSFVEKYNSNMTELDKMTKASTDSETRGIFSSDSTVKSMKRAIADMMYSLGGGVDSMINYGFEIDKDGVMTLDKTLLEQKLDDEPINTQAFFSGGDFTSIDPNTLLTTVTTVTGTFAEMSTIVESYTKVNTTLDQLKDSLSENIKTLEERKITATERLDSKYEIMKKQFAAYGLMISKINSASSMFVQIANAQTAAQN